MSILIAIYILLFAFKPNYAVSALNNSSYYIIEMLQIMPVVFVLTALLDAWVEKDTIMKYLGEQSKIKGAVFSLILGSISAGPIYSAFPICIMLLKKGATIRNIVIILSSWAVVKVPMLVNEVKFLGLKFMVIRWILTVVAIFIFSYITSLIVKPEDLPLRKEMKKGLNINKDFCMGCGICKRMYPEVFYIENKKALIKDISISKLDEDHIIEVCKNCPAKAITYDIS